MFLNISSHNTNTPSNSFRFVWIVNLATRPTSPSRCYVAGGKVRAEGFEAEVTGRVMIGLELSAGYTYNRSAYLSNSDNVDLEGTAFLTSMPEHMLRVWANYLFDRVYYSQIGTVENSTYFGNPRNLMFTARTRF